MSYTMLITHFEEGRNRTFDVSQLVHSIEYTTSIDSQAGKLTFMLEKDLSGVLEIALGSVVQFFSNGKAVFYGKIFTIETDLSDVYRVIAYDMLRYFKNADSILVDENYDLNTLFQKIASAYELDYSVPYLNDQVNFQGLESHYFSNETLFDMMSYYMDIENERMTKSLKPNSVYQTMTAKNYLTRLYLRCNLNVIELREIMYDFNFDENGNRKKTALLIGDESLMTNYNYKVDIDKNTYNRLIFVYNEQSNNSVESDDTNTQVKVQQIVAAMDAGYRITNENYSGLNNRVIGENTKSRWGILSKIVELKNLEPSNMLEDYMKTSLELYSQPNRTLKINAIGHDSIFAGSGFYLHLSKLDINYPVYVISATHRYESDEHMMELEVATNVKMRKFI